MSDKTGKKEDTKPEVVEDAPMTIGNFLAFQAYGRSPYKTNPRMGYGYYSQTTQPARTKSLATAAGISGAGAVAESIINAQRMFDPALEYAERELAEAEALQREPAPKMTEEEKQEIRAGALAAPRAEVAEIKSDVGALMASRGGATVSDLLKVREAGVEKLATAGLEAESKIAKQDVKLQEAHEKKIAAAQKRADTMTQTAFDARQEGRDNWANLASDLTTIAVKVAAEWPEEDERPALDRMVDAGIPMEKITPIHEKAVKSGFWPGTRGYDHYMMSHFDDLKPKDEKREQAEVPEVVGEPVPPVAAAPAPAPSQGQAGALEKLRAMLDAPNFSADDPKHLHTVAEQAGLTEKDYTLEAASKPTGPGEPDWADINAKPSVENPIYRIKLNEGFTLPEAPAAAAPAPAKETPQAKAQRQIKEGFVLPKKDALVKMATTAGLNSDQYTIELEEPVKEGSGVTAAYKIVLKKGVELPGLAAPAADEGEKAEPTKFETHEKFWKESGWGQKEADEFRKWVLSKNPEYKTKVPQMGNMLGTDTLSPSGSFDAKNRTFSSVWDKHGAEYLEWKATQGTK